jgi:hypothetical protein
MLDPRNADLALFQAYEPIRVLPCIASAGRRLSLDAPMACVVALTRRQGG